MTTKGVQSLYVWLSTAWPLVVRPGAPDDWKRAKMRELFETYRDYDDGDVLEGFKKWTELNDKFPTTKNILTEIKFAQAQKIKHIPTGALFSMPIIDEEGNESLVMYNGKVVFTWGEFLAIPRNVNRIDPEEWERRYHKRREAILKRLYGGGAE